MKLKLNITKDDEYYYIGDRLKIEVPINILEKDIHSDRIKIMIERGLLYLFQTNKPAKNGFINYEDIVAQVIDIDLDNGYIIIDDNTINDKYIDLLRKIKESEVSPISVDCYGHVKMNLLTSKIYSITLTGFELKGGNL